MQEKLLINNKIFTRTIVSIFLWLLYLIIPNITQIEQNSTLFGYEIGKILSSLIKPAILIILFQFILYIYDTFLWRLFFIRNDYQGWWLYSNTYLYPSNTPKTQGIVFIEQTPLKIKMIDGKSLKIKNPTEHKALWSSKAMEITKDGSLVSCYGVSRKGIDKPAQPEEKFLLDSLSVEEIFRELEDEFTNFPLTLEGRFYNCIERDFEGTNTLAKRGECKFVRITGKQRKELIELQGKPKDSNNTTNKNPLELKIEELLETKSSNGSWKAVWKWICFIWDSRT